MVAAAAYACVRASQSRSGRVGVPRSPARGDAADARWPEGGIVLLEQSGRIRLSVNVDGARAASLEIQTKLLEVASAVLENGVLHPPSPPGARWRDEPSRD